MRLHWLLRQHKISWKIVSQMLSNSQNSWKFCAILYSSSSQTQPLVANQTKLTDKTDTTEITRVGFLEITRFEFYKGAAQCALPSFKTWVAFLKIYSSSHLFTCPNLMLTRAPHILCEQCIFNGSSDTALLYHSATRCWCPIVEVGVTTHPPIVSVNMCAHQNNPENPMSNVMLIGRQRNSTQFMVHWASVAFLVTYKSWEQTALKLWQQLMTGFTIMMLVPV